MASEEENRKTFEEAYFEGIWQADTCYLTHIKEQRQFRQVILIMIPHEHYQEAHPSGKCSKFPAKWHKTR